jgi:hypothetical protein
MAEQISDRNECIPCKWYVTLTSPTDGKETLYGSFDSYADADDWVEHHMGGQWGAPTIWHCEVPTEIDDEEDDEQ